ncbi:ERF family protein [Streptococcus gordonii]|uniref:ERF family protein n=1 Tax=Streptococcus gordonii TaxID=1302 RepID=UPI000779CFD6|nr:ERF family protein [Streptococcus gordonii]QBX25279.1 essential recombination function protein [Streptococcus phage Javan246]
MAENKMTIYEKLANIQNELKAPKNQYNSFGKYNYRNAEDIEEALKPICLKYRATCLISDVTTEELSNELVTKVSVILLDWDSESIIKVTGRAREERTKKGMDASQVSGGAQSYATKYALSQMFLIDDSKDADTDADYIQSGRAEKKPSSKKQAEQVISSNQASAYNKEINQIAEEKGKTDGTITAWFLQHLGVASYKQIKQSQVEQADALIQKLKGNNS